MLIKINLEQRSQEWFEWRSSRRMASETPVIVGSNLYGSISEIRNTKNGITKEKYITPAMNEGVIREPLLREVYNLRSGKNFVPAVYELDGKYGSSLDGLNLATRELLEIKVSSSTVAEESSRVEMAKNGKVRSDDYAQVQHQLMVMDGLVDKGILLIHDAIHNMDYELIILPEKAFWDKIKFCWDNFYAYPSKIISSGNNAIITTAAEYKLPDLYIQNKDLDIVRSNIENFTDSINEFLKKIDANPVTEEQFFDIKNAAKIMERAEKALKEADELFMSQFEPLVKIREKINIAIDLARTKRLSFTKITSNETNLRKSKLIDGYFDDVIKFYEEKNSAKGLLFFEEKQNSIKNDFLAAIKGLSSIESIENKLFVTRNNLFSQIIDEDNHVNTVYDLLPQEKLYLFPDLKKICHLPVKEVLDEVNSRLAKENEAAIARSEKPIENGKIVNQDKVLDIRNSDIPTISSWIEAPERSKNELKECCMTLLSLYENLSLSKKTINLTELNEEFEQNKNYLLDF